MAEHGVTTFDLQRGVTTFKERFARGGRPLAEMRIAKSTWRCLATATQDFARRGVAKAGRLIGEISHGARRVNDRESESNAVIPGAVP
jgi:CelD/BcsL family acetyltransferase involved in cellulose biosynthesis